MKYVKFILKFILAVSPLIVLMIFTLLCPMSYLDSEYPSWRYTKMVSQGREKVTADTLILGDSRAMAALRCDTVQETSGAECVNLAVGGATSIEMYYFLDEYMNNNPAPERIVIMFAPFHYSYIDNYETRTMFFRALGVTDLPELYRNARLNNAQSVYARGRFAQEISCRLGLPNKYLPPIVNSRFIGRNRDNHALYDVLVQNRGQSYFGTSDGCSDLNYEANYKEMKQDGDSALLDLYMGKLLELSKSSALEVTVCQAPMNESSYTQLDKEYLRQYEDYMDSLSKRYPDIRIDKEIPCMDDAFFGDASHLNEKGAAEFSKQFASTYLSKQAGNN